VLHGVFALSGIAVAVNGPLMPSLSAHFHLNDGEAGTLFLLYFTGNSIGAFLCRSNYARTMALALLALSGGGLGIAMTGRALLFPLFLFMGGALGLGTASVSMYVGKNWTVRRAPTLTLLNFTWSAGALAAPLLVAPLLSMRAAGLPIYSMVYLAVAAASMLAALGCRFLLEDDSGSENPVPSIGGVHNLRLIAVFALFGFLEVGIENNAVAWLPTFLLRASGGTLAAAAASSALYWCGFLASRGISSLLLLRLPPMPVFRAALGLALGSAALLATFPASPSRGVAMFLLGAAMAPLYPLLLAAFLVRARQSSDMRWILGACGFGGSVLPWLTGWISTHSGSLRIGLITVPAALLALICLSPALGGKEPANA
jgi:FHS family glucose/mannose:H+ symporter-like MFS transporter